ncbi:glycoside hydrolase family 97 catalytic domain-containing protein, partial [Staphylococcus aureus]
FTRAYPDYDLRAVAQHARERGVSLIVHNETAMGIANYERQLDSAFALYRALGVTAIKTGYVNDRTAQGHAHTGQFMVR